MHAECLNGVLNVKAIVGIQEEARVKLQSPRRFVSSQVLVLCDPAPCRRPPNRHRCTGGGWSVAQWAHHSLTRAQPPAILAAQGPHRIPCAQ